MLLFIVFHRLRCAIGALAEVLVDAAGDICPVCPSGPCVGGPAAPGARLTVSGRKLLLASSPGGVVMELDEQQVLDMVKSKAAPQLVQQVETELLCRGWRAVGLSSAQVAS